METNKRLGVILILATAVVIALGVFSRGRSKRSQAAKSQETANEVVASKDQASPQTPAKGRKEAFVLRSRVLMQMIPKEHRSRINQVFANTVRAEGFRSSEFSFDKGYISAVVRHDRDDPQKSTEQVAIWPHATDTCELRLPLSNLRPKGKGKVVCR